MADAYDLILKRVGSAPGTTTSYHKAIEYRVTEALRLFEVAIKEEDARALLDVVDKLVNILPMAQADDLQLEAEDAEFHRGVST